MHLDHVRPCAPDIVERVLDGLKLDRAPEPDLSGLDRLYGAYCAHVGFDNLRKRAYFARGARGPLPGSDPGEFWSAWLADRAGGTCWAATSALASLMAALGFPVRRALATMHPGPHAREPNHATLIVEIDGGSWVVDASTLHAVALPLTGGGRRGAVGGAEMRRGASGEALQFWRPLHAPGGVVFRVDDIGVSDEAFAQRHEATRAWSLFNFALSVRVARAGGVLGIALGMRVELRPDGTVVATRLDREARSRMLIDELGYAEAVVAAIPDDDPVAPPPGMPVERWEQVLADFAANAPRPE